MCAQGNNTEDSGYVERLTDDPDARRLLCFVLTYSPFLTSICLGDPRSVADLLRFGPAHIIDGEINRLRALHLADDTLLTDGAQIGCRLRQSKRRTALAVAFGDIAGILDHQKVTCALSSFADAALAAAARSALAQAIAAGRLTGAEPSDPAIGSGLIVLAMGKLGAGELNYSSDIDLITLFDPERVRGCKPEHMQRLFIRITREMVRLMDERSADGYVFRTDLRLRPDPGATPICVALPTAEAYYESQGQNWERAAMIKARVVAGDLDAGQAFLNWLKPFIWRRNLDFGAIQDIHSIKRQIHAHRGSGDVRVAGHNIKIGRGGIREIEFFVQTQQLIWGGRNPDLRARATLTAMDALVTAGRVAREARDDLRAAYIFLRTVEHRLQMVNDEQTQELPADPDCLGYLARFLTFRDVQELSERLLVHLRKVERHYAALFQDAPSLGNETGGNLVFTGVESDLDTLATLSDIGFRHPETVDATVRGWHHGRYRATRSFRARELLTELMPKLLKSMSATPDPDMAVQKFDEFLANMPAGVQLFSMIHSYPQLLDLLAEIMGEAPRLAEVLSRRPSLLDAVLSSDFLNKQGAMLSLTRDLEQWLAREDSFEGILDAARRWTNDRRFLIGMQSLKGIITPPDAAWGLSDVAETALAAIKPHVEGAFAMRHGQVAGEAFCTLALGKLGSHEMTPTSDLDLVFIYPGQGEERLSEGKRPLSRTRYFARLGQRYINAIAAPTAEGILYEVDMRLRPSGNAGPIACSLEAFRHYHRSEAWTWERMALTRARPINGPAPLRRQVAGIVRDVLTMPLNLDNIRRDIADMRQRIAATHHTEELWSIKHLRGGLVDLEFIVQFLQLRHAAEVPAILSPNTWRAIRNLEDAGFLSATDANCLKTALDLWQALQSQLHLSVTMDQDKAPRATLPEALRLHLATLGGVDTFDGVEGMIRETAARVYGIFRCLIEETG